MRHALHALALPILLTAAGAVAAQDHAAAPYAGLDAREIKSLSEEDVAQIRAGQGWGLALPAELNGLPGPAHLLELKEQLGLDPEQVAQVEALFEEMQQEAIAAGARFIAAEAALDAAFASGGLTPEILEQRVSAAAEARGALRYVHLSRHLETPAILTEAQIARYKELRGYAADPCDAVPEGHDPQMWRRHNQCD
ncbi:hypothetical protein [Tropicimonas sediminicola]|uniref:LTXXQ motif family protein n=1 Tax=Tropicimonas sediminicola TaxID=1031541 RepID=A0A239HEL9_9RHOB|nr:hypothetical protein [Tropicimonas sediminicola]SNS79253.1 hypothetical protein SAMN05421757_103359 [Tropicimonas sediminicola]